MKEYLECSCSTHILQVVQEVDDKETTYYMAIFDMYKGKPSWLRRLKYIWTIIKTGSPYKDQLILSQQEMDKLIKFSSKS